MIPLTVKQFLTQDFDKQEYKSYDLYNKGDYDQNSWIDKAEVRRDQLLKENIKCYKCSDWVGIRETGKAECINNHECELIVMDIIHSLYKRVQEKELKKCG